MPVLMVWKPQPGFALPPERIAARLEQGNDVEGLEDLPVKDVIDRVKQEFSGVAESPGLLARSGPAGNFHVTWSWQYIRVEWDNMAEEDRQKLETLARELDCHLYER